MKTIKTTERSTGRTLTIHSVNGRDFSDYYVTRQGERGPVFDTDDDEIESAISAAPPKNPAAVALGRMGGKANTPAQNAARAKSAIENGKKGGRPKRPTAFKSGRVEYRIDSRKVYGKTAFFPMVIKGHAIKGPFCLVPGVGGHITGVPSYAAAIAMIKADCAGEIKPM